MKILAIDPGQHESGCVRLIDGKIVLPATLPNGDVLGEVADIARDGYRLVVENIASYGMAVGAHVFETCRFIGRIEQKWLDSGGRAEYCYLVFRKTVVTHLCGMSKAKDANVKQALKDRLGDPGSKRCNGPTFGVTGHAWQALAVAVYAADMLRIGLVPGTEKK